MRFNIDEIFVRVISMVEKQKFKDDLMLDDNGIE